MIKITITYRDYVLDNESRWHWQVDGLPTKYMSSGTEKTYLRARQKCDAAVIRLLSEYEYM